jgi:hypothetical protein
MLAGPVDAAREPLSLRSTILRATRWQHARRAAARRGRKKISVVGTGLLRRGESHQSASSDLRKSPLYCRTIPHFISAELVMQRGYPE